MFSFCGSNWHWCDPPAEKSNQKESDEPQKKIADAQYFRNVPPPSTPPPVMAGVGIIFAGIKGKQNLFVDALVPDGPAEVSLGDTLVSVDGKDVTGLDDSQLAKLIIGPAGTKVKLGFLRGSDKKVKYATITRGLSGPQFAQMKKTPEIKGGL